MDKPKGAKSTLKNIIEEAFVDCSSEDEEHAGWACILEENISTLQECKANGNQVLLLKVSAGKSRHSIDALVEINGKRLLVPVETLKFNNKKENNFIEAYKE